MTNPTSSDPPPYVEAFQLGQALNGLEAVNSYIQGRVDSAFLDAAQRLLADEKSRTEARWARLEETIGRIGVSLTEHQRHLGARPAWADEILVAIAAIETNRALQAKVDVLSAEVVELSQWRAGRECNAPGCPQRAAQG